MHFWKAGERDGKGQNGVKKIKGTGRVRERRNEAERGHLETLDCQ